MATATAREKREFFLTVDDIITKTAGIWPRRRLEALACWQYR